MRMNHATCSEQLQYQKIILSFRTKQLLIFIFSFFIRFLFYSRSHQLLLKRVPSSIKWRPCIRLYDVIKELYCFLVCQKKLASQSLIDSHAWLFCFGAKYLKTLEKHLRRSPF